LGSRREPGSRGKIGSVYGYLNKTKSMKLIKTLSALAFALALMAGPAFAGDHKQADCCKKAVDDGKTCSHKCCVAAAKDGKECEKCGGSGDLPKKDDAKKDAPKKDDTKKD